MKKALLTLSALALAFSVSAVDSGDAKQSKDAKTPKAKPYPLKTCLIADEKLDADPAMKSYSFVHEGQEIKLCCKSCLKDFKKDTAKYLKKLEKEAKAQAGKGKGA